MSNKWKWNSSNSNLFKYKVLYDYNFKSKKDNSGNFIQSLQNIRNEYDRKFQEINFNNNEIPSLFKNNIVETFKKFNKQPNEKEIKKLIEESEREYPKLMEYNYKYTHPIPKPVFMGTKILYLDDIYRFFFYKSNNFYSWIKNKYFWIYVSRCFLYCSKI